MEFSDDCPTPESRIAHCKEVLANLSDYDREHMPHKAAIYEQAIKDEEAKLVPATEEHRE